MTELERLLKENTDAVHRNSNEMSRLSTEIKAYKETSEKALSFQKEIITKLITHEQCVQDKWQSACIKWGGWIVAAVCGILALLRI